MEVRVDIGCSVIRSELIRAHRHIRADRAEAIEPDGEVQVPFTYSDKRCYVEAREKSIGLEGEGGTTDQGVSFMRQQKCLHVRGEVSERDSMREVLVLQQKRFLPNLVVDLAEMEVGSMSYLVHRR